MIIYKILNNNAVISKNDERKEVIVLGKGIAYKSTVYDEIDEDLVEKIFILDNRIQRSRLEALISEIPLEYMNFSESLIQFVSKRLNKNLDSNLLIALTDHIYNSIRNYYNGIIIPNMLVEEIRTFYADEYELALDMVAKINVKFDTKLDENEAGFLAFHVINAEGKDNMNETIEIIKSMQDIVHLVNDTFKIDLKTSSLDYSRFTVHLKFFLTRVFSKKPTPMKDLSDDGLYKMLIHKYANLNSFLDKIDEYTMNLKNYHITDSDRMYLVIHLARLIHKD
jgi:beta-glucoside operon transcriptional antiterminator